MKKKRPVKREFSAGGAVYRREEGDSQQSKIRWLLVQPAGREKFSADDRWQLPKGWIEKGEPAAKAALREVEEEGGVQAKIISKIDSIKVFFRNIYEGQPKELVLKTITFYLMEYQKDVPWQADQEIKTRAWLPFSEAYRRLTFASEKKILAKAKELLEKQESN